MVAAFTIAASAIAAAANATKTLTLPGGATMAYSWGNALKTVYALCDRMFIGEDGRRVKDLEASSYYFLPLRLDPATGEARLLFGELSP